MSTNLFLADMHTTVTFIDALFLNLVVFIILMCILHDAIETRHKDNLPGLIFGIVFVSISTFYIIFGAIFFY